LRLFRFDGDMTGEGFGGKTYQADFTNRDEAPSYDPRRRAWR
jgi:hypothetical protein